MGRITFYTVIGFIFFSSATDETEKYKLCSTGYSFGCWWLTQECKKLQVQCLRRDPEAQCYVGDVMETHALKAQGGLNGVCCKKGDSESWWIKIKSVVLYRL